MEVIDYGVPNPERAYIVCQQCKVRTSCAPCFEPSTFAQERLLTGERSALCRLCFKRRQHESPEQISEELKEMAVELAVEQIQR